MTVERDANRGTTVSSTQGESRSAGEVFGDRPQAVAVHGSRRVRSVLQTAGFLAAPPRA
jgi:hypothetical protein